MRERYNDNDEVYPIIHKGDKQDPQDISIPKSSECGVLRRVDPN